MVERSDEPGLVGQQRKRPAVLSPTRLLCASLPLLYGCLGAERATAQSATGAGQSSAGGTTVNLGTLPVTAPANNYGGYAAPAVSFGPFGDTPWQDVPFRTFSVPSEVIQDQQAHTPYDILRNDPSVNIAFSPTFTPSGTYTIRGFNVDSTDTKLDGLPIATGSAVNGFSVPPEALDRVDVLTGAAAALYGFAAPAGVINFVSKRPLDTPLTAFTLQYNSLLNAEGAADISRRFGKDDQFGIRVNVAQQDGEGPIEHTAIDRNVAALALDWKPIEGLRFWTNLEENYRNNRGSDPLFPIGSLTSVPNAPDLYKLYGQPWYHNRSETLLAEGGVQYDDDAWHFAASGGWVQSLFDQLYDSNGTTGLRQNGSYSITAYDNPDVQQYGRSFNVQGSRKIKLGFVTDTVGVNYTYSQLLFFDKGYEIFNSLGTSSLLAPTYIPEPDLSISPAAAGSFKQRIVDRTTLVTNRLDLGSYVTLLGGADIASIEQYLRENGIVASGGIEHQSAVSPLVALQVRPWPWMTLYFSYIQALEPGTSAPAGTVNFGTTLPPYVGDQYEVGLKAIVNARLQLGFDLFRIDQQNAFINPLTNLFAANGTARGQGAEFTASGKVTDSLSVISGVTLVDAQVINPMAKTGSTTKVLGTPAAHLTLFAKYAVNRVPGLSLLGGVYFNSPQAVSNTLSIPSYATFDAGATYDFTINRLPVTAAAYIQNLFNNRYWSSAAFGELQLGAPLQANASLTARF